MVRIVIGTEPSQYVPQKVLEHSIRVNTRSPVDIHFVHQKEKRMGGTNFGFVRFYLPSLFDYSGRAIYMDADQLVLADVAELDAALDGDHAIALVTQPEGMFKGRPVKPGNQSSVMVVDCAKLTDWRPETMFDHIVPNTETPETGQIRYADFMNLTWFDPALIQSLDPRWNHFNIVRDDTKLVHFSHVRAQPWKKPSHELAPTWTEWLKAAMAAGAIRKRELAAEIAKGHIHPTYLRRLIDSGSATADRGPARASG